VPTHFNWPLFLLALLAMALPTLRLARRPGFYGSAGVQSLSDSQPAL